MNKPPMKISQPMNATLRVKALPMPAVHSSSSVKTVSVGGISFRTTTGTAMGVPGVRIGKMG